MMFYKMICLWSILEVFPNSKNEKRLLNDFVHIHFFILWTVCMSYTTSTTITAIFPKHVVTPLIAVDTR